MSFRFPVISYISWWDKMTYKERPLVAMQQQGGVS